MGAPDKGSAIGQIWTLAARAVAAQDPDTHLDTLIDLIGADVPHDLVTVTRYSATAPPQFVKHRRFSNAMVEKYLAAYVAFDPFHAWWQRERRPGVLPLKALTDDAAKRGRYIAEFLAGCAITDELGVLLQDGGDWCLGIFLDRSRGNFRNAEIRRLEERFPFFAAVHARRVPSRGEDRGTPSDPLQERPDQKLFLPSRLWPELSLREREVVELVLAGHPTSGIARCLGITAGTVKNHRRRIYEKLDITTERELFLHFLRFE